MRIEVLIGNDDPMIFSLNSTKLVLGSGEQCDIIVSASGISRKHITITIEDDQYYVTDMGSTNGSFMNEERLVPGRRVEFTSFFPVRLGENTLVSLLSDEEDVGTDTFTIPIRKENTSPSFKNPSQETKDQTTVINLNQMKNIRTEHLVLERDRKREIKKKTRKEVKAPPKPKKKPNYVGIFAILIVLGAAYYNFFVDSPSDEAPQEVIKQVGRIIEAPKDSVSKPAVNLDLVAKDDLTPHDRFLALKDNMKCTIDVEIYLCDLIPGARGQGYGVNQSGLSLNVFLDGTHYYNQAKSYIKDKQDKELTALTAAYIFVSKHLPDMNVELLGDNRVLVGFFTHNENGSQLENIVAFKPGAINKNRDKFVDNQLNFVRSVGKTALEFTKDIYTVY